MTAAPGKEDIAGVILAGGLARRMGGQDKGLVALQGRPMIAHVIERITPQVGMLAINANRSSEAYARFGLPLVADTGATFAGPLAGFAAAMALVRTPWLVVMPCDSPFIPADLVARLAARQGAQGADIVAVQAHGRLQPVFALLRTDLHGDLAAFLADGGRKIDAWYARHDLAVADFGADDAFDNINTPEDVAAAEQRLAGGRR